MAVLVDETGVSMFDSMGDLSQPTFDTRCLLAVARMKSNLTNVLPLASNLTACPCNAFQALLSPLHVPIPDTNCFMSLENLKNYPQYVSRVIDQTVLELICNY